MQVILYRITSLVIICTYLGLGIFVVGQNPRRRLSWIFLLLAVGISSYYFTGPFIFPGINHTGMDEILAILRWRWVTVVWTSAFYFYLITYYFPPALRPWRNWLLSVSFIVAIVLIDIILFTNLIVAGTVFNGLDKVVTALQGPAMPVCLSYAAFCVVGGSITLIPAYRNAILPTIRSQISSLFVPFIVYPISYLLKIFITIEAGRTGVWVTWLSDLGAVISGFAFAIAALDSGTLGGFSANRRKLFGAALVTLVLGFIVFLVVPLDFKLFGHMAERIPYLTILALILLSAAYPFLNSWYKNKASPLIEKTGTLNTNSVMHLPNVLDNQPISESLLPDMLETLTRLLECTGAYFAVPDTNKAAGHLLIESVYGSLPGKVGDPLVLPGLFSQTAQFTSTLLTDYQETRGWEGVAMFSPVSMPEGQTGLLAAGLQKNERPYQYRHLSIMDQYRPIFEAAIHARSLAQKRQLALSTVLHQDRAIAEIDQMMVHSTSNLIRTVIPDPSPLEIFTFGPLRVVVKGKPLSSAAWGVERTRALLGYLLWQGQKGCTREAIQETLWPDVDRENSANSFHVTLYRLRRALEPGLSRGERSSYIHAESGRYFFNYQSDHQLDCALFSKLAISTLKTDLIQAINLYQGSFLQDVITYLPSDATVDVVAYEQLFARALHNLVEQMDHDPETAIYYEKLMAVEPGNFTSRRRLIEIYHDAGRKDLVQQHIEHWQNLTMQSNINPLDEDRDWYRHIRKQYIGQTGPLKNWS
jgi:DNA-binding SARP family transcriptional activator